ncbi:alpha/beta hydrolase [Kaistella jeonii]|uniref:Carbohydrate esterase n=1 Tax=Kaistella jeonii TaxID=266749 RepID=A0A0C1FLU7_9FLAO|nr:alpha/beta hydrolase-fold protein [Kaistella jeonii]KIA88909.1 carbohydrate esterase [Kaistella jeonii]SFC12938.1 Predicted hydrolase of the alpha/beta superfamily [Kaistella jeonii]VEI94477.1 Predicted hydrolase of the alpha/beta superfamily [Kaistella jeonii]
MNFTIISNEDDDRPVFITGNFNKWDPKDLTFQLKLIDTNSYTIDIEDEKLPEAIEYKYTRGGWGNVEIDRFGNITPNRKANKSDSEKEDHVERWRVNWGPFKKEFFPIVEIISEKFFIPQLNRTRKIWALLPYNYHKTKKDYPVLYLHDAQNLFNEGSAFGNWEIDQKMSILAEYGRGDVIIIAIENGSEDRIKEYVLDNNSITENAEGKKYIRFLADTLKPYVDSVYRTKPEREFTGIGGSSLGALISIYSGFLYPEVYSKLMIFSPSLWINPENNFPQMNFKNPYDIKVYLYGGELEGSQMTERIQLFEKTMEGWEDSHSLQFEFKISINHEGKHQEFFWSQEFPRAVEWLFYDTQDDPKELAAKAEIIRNETTEI